MFCFLCYFFFFFFFSSRRRHTRWYEVMEFRRVLFRSSRARARRVSRAPVANSSPTKAQRRRRERDRGRDCAGWGTSSFLRVRSVLGLHFLHGPERIQIPKHAQRDARGQHRPRCEEKQIVERRQILLIGRKGRDCVKEQHQTVGVALRGPGDETDQQQQLKGADDVEHSRGKAVDAVELLEYPGGVSGADELVERPHQHDDEDSDAEQKERQANSVHDSSLGCVMRTDYLACNLLSVWSESAVAVSIPRPSNQRGPIMNRYVLAASTLSTAVGLALAIQASPGQAQGKMDMSKMPQVVKDNMARMEKGKLEKCYGINAAAKNDCAEGAHSCAGQATKARDTKSFVLLPAGDCSKIQGGKTTAS